MKKLLGSLLLVIFFTVLVEASEYTWSVSFNKQEAHVNEAIHLKYVCHFIDNAELYVIEFNPTTDNEKYKIEILREDEKIVDGHKINEYEFVLFVKKAGKFSLSLDALMKKTNKDSIENGMLGRDNANYEEFSIYKYKQKTIEVNILETPSKIVGEFTLSVKKDKEPIDAFEPYHLEFLVQGIGDFQVFKDINITIEGVEVFTEKAQENVSLKADGYSGTWRKKFAFVSDKSFKIPSWKIEYFDLQARKIKFLHFDGLDIEVKAAKFKKEQLLDKDAKGFEFRSDYLYYFLSFVAGFLLAKVKFRKIKEANPQEELFCKKVKAATSLEKLSFILVTKDMNKYKKILSEIEHKELTSLSKAKNLICN